VDLKCGLSHSKLKRRDLWCDVQLLTVFWEFKTRDGAHFRVESIFNEFGACVKTALCCFYDSFLALDSFVIVWRASALAAVRFKSKSSSRLGWTICPISLRSQPQLKI
jgi:hypothetical protein